MSNRPDEPRASPPVRHQTLVIILKFMSLGAV